MQRDNAEMERRAQEVIDRCWQSEANPIAFIHDVARGGLSNALPELVKDGGCGGDFDLAAVPRGAAWAKRVGDVVQRSAGALRARRCAGGYGAFLRGCASVSAVRLPWSANATAEKRLVLRDGYEKAIDLPMKLLFGSTPKMERSVTRQKRVVDEIDLSGITIDEAVKRLLRLLLRLRRRVF